METTNHECYVSLEVAKLLKEAGFDWESHFTCEQQQDEWQQSASIEVLNPHYDKSIPFSSPTNIVVLPHVTLDVAQRWLRKVKNYYVSVDVDCDSIGVFYTVRYVFHDGDKYNASYIWEDTGLSTVKHRRIFDNFEEAQEAGIQKCLTLLLEEKK